MHISRIFSKSFNSKSNFILQQLLYLEWTSLPSLVFVKILRKFVYCRNILSDFQCFVGLTCRAWLTTLRSREAPAGSSAPGWGATWRLPSPPSSSSLWWSLWGRTSHFSPLKVGAAKVSQFSKFTFQVMASSRIKLQCDEIFVISNLISPLTRPV